MAYKVELVDTPTGNFAIKDTDKFRLARNPRRSTGYRPSNHAAVVQGFGLYGASTAHLRRIEITNIHRT